MTSGVNYHSIYDQEKKSKTDFTEDHSTSYFYKVPTREQILKKNSNHNKKYQIPVRQCESRSNKQNNNNNHNHKKYQQPPRQGANWRADLKK